MAVRANAGGLGGNRDHKQELPVGQTMYTNRTRPNEA